MKGTEPTATGGGAAAERNARIGLRLFAVYLVLYVGFMALNVIDPFSMATPIGPLNYAIAYAFLLIVTALVLALIYTRLCRDDEGGRS